MDEHGVELVEARVLNPENTKIVRGTFNMLQVMVKDDAVYRGVFAVQAFPISSPNRYVFFFHYDDEDRIQEIGMIENLAAFPPEIKKLILEALGKHYYAYEIVNVYDVKWEFGLLGFDVETDKGRRQFSMRWQQHRAEDFGEKGKILLDIFDDRYIIPDVSALPTVERELFTRWVYW